MPRSHPAEGFPAIGAEAVLELTDQVSEQLRLPQEERASARANVPMPTCRHRSHPWSDLEKDFARLRKSRDGRSVPKGNLKESLERIAERSRKTARGIFLRWKRPDPRTEAEDASQLLLYALWGVILFRCDRRPVHRLAYKALWNICSAESRRARRSVALPHGIDPEDDLLSSLDVVIDSEEQEMFDEGVAALPPRQQEALRWVDRVNGSSSARYMNAYRARKALMNRFASYREINK